MAPNVATSDKGTVMLGMMVAHSERRNRKITITTSAIVTLSVNSTSLTEALMVCERSDANSILTEGGMDARSCGIMALTCLTMSIVFAPGERSISKSSQRWSPYQAPVLGNCEESM